MMKFGFVLPFGTAQTAVEIGQLAEQVGWDGFFVWEPVWGIDAWVSLTAVAMRTERIKLGTMLSPISRMRPWKLASETATLDNLSGGRVILAVGMGALETGFANFGEATDRKTRAELLDEGLDILTGLWQGQPFAYEGKHYHVKPTTFSPPPPPLQQPRIPIWVVGAWPHEKSMQRVLRYDGLLPQVIRVGEDNGRLPQQATADEVREMAAYVAARRTAKTPFDIIVEGQTPGDNPAEAQAVLHPWQEAGATWWIEAMWHTMEIPNAAELIRQRVAQGPPR